MQDTKIIEQLESTESIELIKEFSIEEFSEKKESEEVLSDESSDNSSEELAEKEEEFKDIYNIKVNKSLNNTIITITDSAYRTIATTSCGRIGYKKGKRKHTNAYQAIWYTVIHLLKKKQIDVVNIYFTWKVHFAFKTLVPLFFKKHNLKVLNVYVEYTKAFNGCKLVKNK